MINRFIAKVAVATTLVAGAAFMALPATASTIDWTLQGVTFDDTGTASGTFSTNSANGNLIAFNITTTAGTSSLGFVYNSTTSYIVGNNYWTPISFVIDSLLGISDFSLAFINPLTNPGVDVLVVGSYPAAYSGSTEGIFAPNPLSRNVVSGEAISGTPLPSTWLMLLSGFVGLGFLAFRGTKKGAAALAAA
jgi:hypothetical protein